MADDSQHRTMSVFQAAEDGSIFLLKDLVHAGQPTDTVDQSGLTALMYASRKGRKDCVEFLCNTKCNINAKTRRSGSTALSEVVTAECAKILIAHKADVNHRDEWGQSCLILALEDGRVDVAFALLEGKADPTFCDTRMRDALHLAAWGGHTEVCRMLLTDYGMDPARRDNDGKSAIDYANAIGNAETIALLHNPPHPPSVPRSGPTRPNLK